MVIVGILCLSIIWVLPSRVKAEQGLEAVVNGGFESGDLTGWSAGSAGEGSVAVVTTNPHSGQYCECITGLGTLTQTFQGIPTSSIRSVTVWERTDMLENLQICELFYSDNVDEIYGDITNSWSFFDVTPHLRTDEVLVGIFLGGWTLTVGNHTTLENKYFDDVSILYTAPPQQSSTSVSCSPNPVSIGQPVTCIATVSGYNPTGTITWSTSSGTGNFSQSICPLSNGTCSTTYTDNLTGSVTIAASYSGDSNNMPSSGTFILTVTSGGPVYYSANYTSVQTAIDAAPSGATVIIAPGFYTESLLVDKPLTIIGEKDPPVFGGGASSIYLTLLSGASGSNVTGIEMTNWPEGILVVNASNCRIYSNIMASIGGSGIVLEGNNATHNFIFNNIFQDTPTPINLTDSAGNNTIYGNMISSLATVTLDIGANGNSVYGNSISARQVLLNMTTSQGNILYHNNFLATVQLTVLATGNNRWDNGYPSGGNYWSNYIGTDIKSGSQQNLQGSDGIGDTPYIISSNNTDDYPRMKPWTVAAGHCVAVISVVAAKTVIGQGFNCSVTVNVADKGEYAESFNITAYANATALGTRQVSSLNASCQMLLTFAWNTAGLAYGNYTVSAYAQPVAGQTDVSSNDFTLGTLKVTIPGDVNGDFKVGLPDLVLLAQAYGSKPRDSNWNLNADIDGNNALGLSDLVILAQHYGQHYP